jgi:NAD(P)-dependent dehydrogenase (short-subunit alcohol dehydrogenase family)
MAAAATAHKVALITAGTAGLGAQVARVLAPDFRVVRLSPSLCPHPRNSMLTIHLFPQVINYANNTTRADALLTELSSIRPSPSDPDPPSPRFHSIRADVSSKPAVESLVAETLSTMGRLDVVISNHGWTRLTNFLALDEGLDDADWDRCFTFNVKSHLWLMAACRAELDAREGAFVTTASVAGVKPSGSSLPYAVTKAAQIHLAKSLAVICSPRVRVNSVSPGLMLTEWGMQFPEAKREASRNNTKLKRLATVEDVAMQIRTLVLSRSVTGQNLLVDGGLANM